jgi:hypothetical protein
MPADAGNGGLPQATEEAAPAPVVSA